MSSAHKFSKSNSVTIIFVGTKNNNKNRYMALWCSTHYVYIHPIFLFRSPFNQYNIMFMITVKHFPVVTLYVRIVIHYKCYHELYYIHAMIIIIYNQKIKLHDVYRHWQKVKMTTLNNIISDYSVRINLPNYVSISALIHLMRIANESPSFCWFHQFSYINSYYCSFIFIIYYIQSFVTT